VVVDIGGCGVVWWGGEGQRQTQRQTRGERVRSEEERAVKYTVL